MIRKWGELNKEKIFYELIKSGNNHLRVPGRSGRWSKGEADGFARDNSEQRVFDFEKRVQAENECKSHKSAHFDEYGAVRSRH